MHLCMYACRHTDTHIYIYRHTHTHTHARIDTETQSARISGVIAVELAVGDEGKKVSGLAMRGFGF